MKGSAANTTLAILAGGAGSRMGQPKGLITIRAQPILQYLAQTIRWPGPTLLVTSSQRQSPPGSACFDREVIDEVPDQGPLRGILTALKHIRTQGVVVMPVDMPAIGFEPLGWLAECLHQSPTAVAIMLRHQADVQPLPAAFRREAIGLIENQLAGHLFSLRSLAECQGVQILSSLESWPESVWTNLNFPADLARFEPSLTGKFCPDSDTTLPG